MEGGTLTLRPMPSMAMAASALAMALAMEATVMVVLATATARGLLRPSPGTDGGDSAEPPLLVELLLLARTLSPQTTLPHRRALLGASTGVWSRGRLTLRPMPTTAMEVTVVATPMASKCQSCSRELQPLKLPLEQND